MRFRLREFEPGEMIAREPGLLALEVFPTDFLPDLDSYVFPVRLGDVAALNSIALQLNAGEPFPIEAGE